MDVTIVSGIGRPGSVVRGPAVLSFQVPKEMMDVRLVSEVKVGGLFRHVQFVCIDVPYWDRSKSAEVEESRGSERNQTIRVKERVVA
jgi:hypothetical protein